MFPIGIGSYYNMVFPIGNIVKYFYKCSWPGIFAGISTNVPGQEYLTTIDILFPIGNFVLASLQAVFEPPTGALAGF